MRKSSYIFTFLILILSGCIENQIEIPFGKEFIEKESMYIFHLDSDSIVLSPLIKSIEKKTYKYEIKDDTLFLYDNFDVSIPSKLFIQFMNNDSIKLIDCRPDSIFVDKREFSFYREGIVYDSTLLLKSITFEKSVAGGYAHEAITLNDSLKFYVRKDFGTVEVGPGEFEHQMIDYEGTIADSTFLYVQDLVRVLDFEFINRNFGSYSTAHVYWKLDIEFKNGDKYRKEGIDITENLTQIWWYNFSHVANSIELNEIEQIKGIGWKKNNGAQQ